VLLPRHATVASFVLVRKIWLLAETHACICWSAYSNLHAKYRLISESTFVLGPPFFWQVNGNGQQPETLTDDLFDQGPQQDARCIGKFLH